MRIKYIGMYTPESKKLYDYINKNYPAYISEENPELIVVAGGDGSMLHAIKDYSYLNIPFFGIGMGTLDFIMNDISNPEKLMKTIVNKTLDIVDSRSMSVRVERDGENVYSGLATNDIMLGNGIMDYHRFNINTEDHSFNDYLINGQSLIISTAIGSTAISYNNGAAVIPSLDMDLFSFSSVLSEKHKKFNKFIRSNQEISIDILSERQACKLFVDGTATIFNLEKNDTVILRRGKRIKIAFLNYEEFELKRLS